MLIKEITQYLEELAPLQLQESYDNSGLIIGDKNQEISKILITLDVTEDVIEEAKKSNCNLIIAHHPIIFSGIKKLNGNNYVERCVISAIKKDIAIYAIHTNLDNVKHGVNKKFADLLQLQNQEILSPKKEKLLKLTTYVPKSNVSAVLSALHNAGAGHIGEYSECSFISSGKGHFKPSQNANPLVGEKGEKEEVDEERIELILPSHLEFKVLQALKESHPYEEAAYYISKLNNTLQDVGSGMLGELDKEMETLEFLKFLKEQLQLDVIKHTKSNAKKIKKVALCGGSGMFLLPKAIAKGADIYISSDFKYHEYFDAENKLVIADIGHYESEVRTKDLIYTLLSEKFSNIALVLSKINTNPISYFK